MSSEKEDLNQLIKRTCVTDITGNYGVYNNCFLTTRYSEYAKEIDDLEVNDTDIWVTSFPKTGTTWTQEMVYLIQNDCNFELTNEILYSRFPFLEVCSLNDFTKLQIKNQGDFIAAESISCVKNYKRTPRFVKTHLPWYLLPKSIQNGEKHPKIVHVTRNPKDTCTSYYYHYVRVHFFTGNFDEFCRLFLADKLLYAPYWQNVLSYWVQRNQPNVLFIKYEDMKTDLKSVIVKTAKFLNKNLSDDQIEKLIKHLSFESMRDNSAVNFQHRAKKGDTPFMRKGVVGDHKNIMSPEIIQKFDQWIACNDKGIF